MKIPFPGSERVKRALFALEDRCFDILNRVDTAGIVPSTSLHTSSEWKGHATAYHAVWTRNIRTLINECSASGERPMHFIDIGCGKGKACFYAAKSGKFTSVLGIDFDESLIQTANSNLARFGRSSIEFRHADATTFDVGERKSLIFMFNPFDAIVLRTFVLRNLDSFRRRQHLLAYANDLNHHTLIDAGFSVLFRDQERKISLWQAH